ncbi:hypothetical protein GT042_16970, partial [Streptomyces sp. SID3212]
GAAARSGPVSAEDFGRAASPGAVRLAAHLAAMAPVSVPVMQLVHACLDGQRGLAPLAEVLLGGLLQPVAPLGEPWEGGRHRFFDFTAEAKDLLLDAVPTSDLIDVGDRVGERIEALVGRSSDFPAWLMPPPPPEGADDDGASRPFARLGPTLQRRFGLVPEVAVGSAVALRPAEEWYAAIPDGALSTSLMVLLGAAGYSSESYAREIGVAEAPLAEYLDGTTVPPWSLVESLLRRPTGPRRPPAGIRDAVRDQYVARVLATAPEAVREAFAEMRHTMRLSSVPRDAELLLLRVLGFLVAPPWDNPYTGTPLFQAEMLSRNLNQFGIVLERENSRGESSLSREDMIWRTDGLSIPIGIEASRPWEDVMDGWAVQEMGASAPVSFLIVVDDSNDPEGPTPLRECATLLLSASGALVVLRHHAWRGMPETVAPPSGLPSGPVSPPPSQEPGVVTPLRTSSDARTAFSAALSLLYSQAGSPTQAALSSRVSAMSGSVSVAKSTVGAWLRGETVPSSGAVFALLVTYLRQLARERGHRPLTIAEFETMRAAAVRNQVTSNQFERGVCVAVSIAGYADRSERGQNAEREIVRDLVFHAAAATEVPYYESHDMGDGLHFVFYGRLDEPAVVSAFLDDLSAGVARAYAKRQHPGIRVAVDRGPIRRTESGAIGAVVIRAARLLDSVALRESLFGWPSQQYGLIVSEALHPEVTRRLPGRFEPVHVGAKDMVIKAWLRTPPPRAQWVGSPERSNAVLVGTAHYAHLPDLPGVAEGVGALAELLKDTAGGAFAAHRTTVALDVPDAAPVLAAIADAADAATHTLLVYLAGHALVESGRGRVTFLLPDTEPHAMHVDLDYGEVARIVQRSAAQHKVVILECCVGRKKAAEGFMFGTPLDPPGGGAASLRAGEGTTGRNVVLAALCAPSSESGERVGPLSPFAGAVVRVLEQGVPGGPEHIGADLLHDQVAGAYPSINVARWSWGESDAPEAPLAINRAHRPPPAPVRDAH